MSRRFSFRFLIGTWLLVAIVLVNGYAGILVPSLTIQTMNPTVESLEDLAANKQEGITLAVNVDTILGRAIMVSLISIFP